MNNWEIFFLCNCLDDFKDIKKKTKISNLAKKNKLHKINVKFFLNKNKKSEDDLFRKNLFYDKSENELEN